MKIRHHFAWLSIIVFCGWFGTAFYSNRRAARELAQALDDANQAALWEASRGGRGEVRVSVLDACSDMPTRVEFFRHAWTTSTADVDSYAAICPLAVRGALRFYSDLGGAHGCAQVRRALSIYPHLGDEASLAAAAKCLERK